VDDLIAGMPAKQRGHARLPHPELITVEFLILDGKAFKGNKASEYWSLSGREGGHAPAVGLKSRLGFLNY
jgi:hypothetical protein